MSLYTMRPISDRTNFTGSHRHSDFSATWSATRTLLARELRALVARNVALEIDVPEGSIRLDGELKANARANSPAVRLAFDSKHGPLVYATDRFWSWQDNIRAIALGLEALRKVDRYGITRRGEQYAGWKALPAGSAAATSHMLRSDAVDLMVAVSQTARGEPLEKMIRRAKANAHPDHHGGDRTLWDQVEQAARILQS